MTMLHEQPCAVCGGADVACRCAPPTSEPEVNDVLFYARHYRDSQDVPLRTLARHILATHEQAERAREARATTDEPECMNAARVMARSKSVAAEVARTLLATHAALVEARQETERVGEERDEARASRDRAIGREFDQVDAGFADLQKRADILRRVEALRTRLARLLWRVKRERDEATRVLALYTDPQYVATIAAERDKLQAEVEWLRREAAREASDGNRARQLVAEAVDTISKLREGLRVLLDAYDILKGLYRKAGGLAEDGLTLDDLRRMAKGEM